jgi:hypothetical protein
MMHGANQQPRAMGKAQTCRTCKKLKKGCGCKRKPRTCKVCGKPKKDECQCKKSYSTAARKCKTCGGLGHDSRNCPEKKDTATRTCRKCGEVGHDARTCPAIPRLSMQVRVSLEQQLGQQRQPFSDPSSFQLYTCGLMPAHVQVEFDLPGFRGGACGSSRIRTLVSQPNSRYQSECISVEARLSEGRRSDYGTKRVRTCTCTVETVLMNKLAQQFPGCGYMKRKECYFCRVH